MQGGTQRLFINENSELTLDPMTKKVTEKHDINGHDLEFSIRLAVMYRKSEGNIGDLFQQKGVMFAMSFRLLSSTGIP